MTTQTVFAREYRDLSWTPRWGIIRVNRRQSVAEHSYYVTLYSHLIAKLIGHTQALDYLLLCALYHDVEEAYTSDIPGPVKRKIQDKTNYENFVEKGNADRYGKVPSPNLKEKAILGVAGMLDETLYICGEMQSGNKAVEGMFKAVNKRLNEKVDDLVRVHALSDDLNTKLRQEIKDAIVREMGQCSILVEG